MLHIRYMILLLDLWDIPYFIFLYKNNKNNVNENFHFEYDILWKRTSFSYSYRKDFMNIYSNISYI